MARSSPNEGAMLTVNNTDESFLTAAFEGLLLGSLVALLAGAMTWASRMAADKNRSRLWVLGTFLWLPTVLVLWYLPARRR
jgi:hypothetical protein